MWGRKKKAKKEEPKKKVPKQPKKKLGTKAKFSKPDSKEESKEEAKKHSCDTMFKIYATDTEMGKPIIGGEGISLLAEDLKLDLTKSAEILVFMWNCQCEEYGQISNSEFQKGCETLGVKDFSDFKKQVPKKLRATLA